MFVCCAMASVECIPSPKTLLHSLTPSSLVVTEPSSSLIPSDVIQITAGSIIPCDVALLTGSATINEAMLTGESAPVVKSELPLASASSPSSATSEEVYKVDEDMKYTIYAGTQVLEVRSPDIHKPVESFQRDDVEV